MTLSDFSCPAECADECTDPECGIHDERSIGEDYDADQRTLRACGRCLRTIHGPVFGHIGLVAAYCSDDCRAFALAAVSA
jgi:hypothetical protein